MIHYVLYHTHFLTLWSVSYILCHPKKDYVGTDYQVSLVYRTATAGFMYIVHRIFISRASKYFGLAVMLIKMNGLLSRQSQLQLHC